MSKGLNHKSRETRLSAALRENLRRRKAQAQARAVRVEPGERERPEPASEHDKKSPTEETA